MILATSVAAKLVTNLAAQRLHDGVRCPVRCRRRAMNGATSCAHGALPNMMMAGGAQRIGATSTANSGTLDYE